MLRKRLPRRLDPDGLYAYAIRLLAGRSLSVGEVRRKLAAKAANSTAVDGVIARLQELGWLDDQRFAESYAAARRDNDALGPFRVLQDLRKRQVDSGLAETAVREAFLEVDEEAQARAFLERKYRGRDLNRFLAEEKNAAQAYRRLRTAGFSVRTTVGLLRAYTPRASELESLEEAAQSGWPEA